MLSKAACIEGKYGMGGRFGLNIYCQRGFKTLPKWHCWNIGSLDEPSGPVNVG
jgi:hypothetical protein